MTATFESAGFAPSPPERRGVARDQVRLLVARPDGVRHHRFADLPDQLRPGDIVVVNDSATVPGEVNAVLAGRGAVVVHLGARLDDGTSILEVRTAPDARRAVLDADPGDVLTVGRAEIHLLEPFRGGSSPTGLGNRLWRARLGRGVRAELSAHGRPIAYGYLDRSYPLEDYQTVFATRPGSAEMASAGRPFSHEVVTRLASRGVAVATLTLHTGLSSPEASEGPQPEWFEVPAATARLVNAVRAGGGRVVAVGTTATRALESAADGAGVVSATSGWTERVVTSEDPPRVVGGLVTGWHDPEASHLRLVEAVAGRELTHAAYEAARRHGYLWHEFGDSALLLPSGPA